MASPLRIDLRHCLYPVLSRTNSRDIVFPDSRDRAESLRYLAKAKPEGPLKDAIEEIHE